MILTYSDFQFLKESENKKACIGFGRCNPVTVGHQKMFKKIAEVGKQNNAVPMMFLSHTQDKKKNPLSYEQKIKYAQSGAPSGLKVMNSPSRTIYEVITELGKLGYKEIYVVCGSDRLQEFEKIKSYTEKLGVDMISIVSAGQRDDDSDDITSSISASKMREYAIKEDFEMFKKGAGCSSDLIKNMYNDVRKGMGIYG